MVSVIPVPVPKTIVPTNTGIDIKTVGVWCSGGVDSSLMLYLVTKEIIEKNLDIEIIPLTMRRPKPSNPYFASEVVEFLENHFNYQYKDHLIHYPSMDNYDGDEEWDRDFFYNLQEELYSDGIIQRVYNGTTLNPPIELQIQLGWDGVPGTAEKSRGQHHGWRQWVYKKPSGLELIEPFRNTDKKGVAKVYKDEGLVETLFPLTRSCEDPNGLIGHCGWCWWCSEREWAFGKLE